MFSTPMVLRILTCAKCGHISVPFPCERCGSTEFRKTQTRRVLKLPLNYSMNQVGEIKKMDTADACWFAILSPEYPNVGASFDCPYGILGDRLWVRETWTFINIDSERKEVCIDYNADGESLPNRPSIVVPQERFDAFYEKSDRYWKNRKRPSIFMPRLASRITLEITDIRAQRVQEISEEDAKAEGCKASDVFLMTQVGLDGKEHFLPPGHPLPNTCRGAFAVLWDSINHKRDHGFDKNDWVWALSFRRVAA